MKPYNEYDELLGTERHKERTMKWELVNVTKEPEWVQDKSGVYTIISRIGVNMVRLDLMKTGSDKPLQTPIRSWQGGHKAVRKAFMQWAWDTLLAGGWISTEHASYIGEQLALAAVLPDFMQD